MIMMYTKSCPKYGGVRTTVLSAGPDGVVGVNAVETMFNAAPSSIDKLQALQVRGKQVKQVHTQFYLE